MQGPGGAQLFGHGSSVAKRVGKMGAGRIRLRKNGISEPTSLPREDGSPRQRDLKKKQRTENKTSPPLRYSHSKK